MQKITFMKLNKILAMALAVVTLSSCDNDNAEDYPSMLGGVNTAGGVTVSLPATFTAKENEMPFMLPVNVTGEPNGKIVVTVQAKELSTVPTGLEPAKVNEHYIFTSYTINIAADESTGYFEVMPVWVQGEINDDRVFEVSIVAVEGATVENANCEVTITNVDDPYTSMFGKWKFTSTRSNAGNEFTLTIGGPGSDSEYYGKELYAYGLKGLSYVFLPLNFEYDMETGEKTLSIQTGTVASDGLLNFSGLGSCLLAGVNVAADTGFGDDIPMTYTLSDNGLETIEMTNMNDGWALAVMPYPALDQIAGYWGTWYGIKLTRQN